MKGIEPPTPSLPWKCSTPELHRLVQYETVRQKLTDYVKSKFVPKQKTTPEPKSLIGIFQIP